MEYSKHRRRVFLPRQVAISFTMREIIIRNNREELVARINTRDSLLHGHCEWYDGYGKLMAYGFFDNGVPFSGTFLNWGKFFAEFSKENPFEAALYSKDWVFLFEACFRSEAPKYEKVIEAYYKGAKMPCESLPLTEASSEP